MRRTPGVALTLLLLLAGCGQSGPNEEPPPLAALGPQEATKLAGAWQLYSQPKPDPDALPEDRPLPPEPSPEIIKLQADGTFKKLTWRTGDERDSELSSEGRWQIEGPQLVLRPERVATHTREQFEQGLREEMRQKGKQMSDQELKTLFDSLYSDIRLTPDRSQERLNLEPKGDGSPDVIFKHHNWFYVRAR